MSEVENLQARVEELEELLGLHLQLPNMMGLTPLHIKIVGLLVKKDIISANQIYWALYGDLPESDQPDFKTVDVHICNVRRKLKPHGIEIKNRYAVGYYLEAASRKALKDFAPFKSAFKSLREGVPA